MHREKKHKQGFNAQDIKFELEEARAVAAAKESLLLLNMREMEDLYGLLHHRVQELEAAHCLNREMFFAIMETLARTLEAKDRYTRGHSERVARYTVRLASGIGLDREYVENLRQAASLHDIGKIGVREELLNKPGRLSPSEYSQIREHTAIGAKILEPMSVVEGLIPWIKHHHERYDGDGYPGGLKGEDIPLGARIISLADSYDAMTSHRPYRRALSPLEVEDEIRRGAGTQFDPRLSREWIKLQFKSM